MVLEKEPRVLYLVQKASRKRLYIEQSLNIRDLKACLHTDILPPARTYLLIEPLLMAKH